MNRQQINLLLQNCNYESPYVDETHISWLFFTRNFAYKIKKDVKFSFVDFSTLEKRKYYCEREYELNKRLAPELYLGVVPVCQTNGSIFVDHCEGEVIDYALKMNRVDSSHEMDRMLIRGEVTNEHMDQMVDQLVDFHVRAEKVIDNIDLYQIWQDFADILNHKDLLAFYLGVESEAILEEGVAFAKGFLNLYKDRFIERRKSGYTVDGHGDLHTGNIFIEDRPIIFDCIEFNDRLRQVDILDEIAFFSLDLESFGRNDLAEYFLQRYLLSNNCMPKPEDHLIFLYYKFYRANVKVKISLLKLIQATNEQDEEFYSGQLHNYYRMFLKYMDLLKEKVVV